MYFFGCSRSQLQSTGSFIVACRILSCGILSLSCSMWGLGPWPEIEPWPPALGAWTLSHRTTREIPCAKFFTHFISLTLHGNPFCVCSELPPLCRGGNWGLERLNDWPRAPQPMDVKAGLQVCGTLDHIPDSTQKYFTIIKRGLPFSSGSRDDSEAGWVFQVPISWLGPQSHAPASVAWPAGLQPVLFRSSAQCPQTYQWSPDVPL